MLYLLFVRILGDLLRKSSWCLNRLNNFWLCFSQNYIDPRNPNHAKIEAKNLLDLGDTNGDDRLSLKEVIDNLDLFYGSKMVNTGLSFHDEF